MLSHHAGIIVACHNFLYTLTSNHAVLEPFSGTVSIVGRYISNLRFENNIDLIAGSKCVLAELTNSMDKPEISVL